MRKKKVRSRTYIITVTEYQDSFDVLIDMPEGHMQRSSKISHEKGTGDWVFTVGWIAGLLGMCEDEQHCIGIGG